jgi:hypothetical protein
MTIFQYCDSDRFDDAALSNVPTLKTGRPKDIK